MLPPDLPQTYIRIFEVMDSTYPKQTTTYIKRLLKWLVFEDTFSSHEGWNLHLTIHTLCEAICIEDDGHWPTIDCIPSPGQLICWLGCLLRVDDNNNSPSLSHFTIKEFLLMNMGLVSSHAAREYLVTPEDERQLLNVCLKYALHSHASKIVFTSRTAIEQLLSERPFYRYVVESLCWLLSRFAGPDAERDHLMEMFLCMPPSREFELWKTSYATLESQEEYDNDLVHHLPTPLHFACFLGLKDQVETLLNQGVDPNTTGRMNGWEILPIHLAITSQLFEDVLLRLDRFDLWWSEDDLNSADDPHETVAFQITRMLVHYGADVNAQLRLVLRNRSIECATTTPLGIALVLENWTIASLLLDQDADWDATASDAGVDNKGEDILDLCSVRQILDTIPERENVVRRAAMLSGREGLMTMVEEWSLSQEQDGINSQSTGSPQDTDPDPQKKFVDAFSSRNWLEVQELLTNHPDLDVNCVDQNGMSAVYLASKFEGDALSWLLERGANPDLITPNGYTALYAASKKGHSENMKLLLRLGANIEHRGPHRWTPLLLATNAGHKDAVQLLLDFGADTSSTLNDGEGAIHLAIKAYDATVFNSLLTRGINCFSPDNYGTTPLHLACDLGLEDVFRRLLVLSTGVLESVNAHSLIWGTPLYVAARNGHDSMVTILLNLGAIIDRIGPGNLLGSALMVACAGGENEIVQILLSRGAALEVDGSRFKSAEGTARAFRKDKVLKILEEHEKNSNQERGRPPTDADIVDLDDREVSCTGEAKENSDRGVNAGHQVGLTTMVSVQPAIAELPIRNNTTTKTTVDT